MLTLIIGLLLSALATFFYVVFHRAKQLPAIFDVLGPVFITILLGLTIIIGVFYPINGYTNWKEEERTELVGMNDTFLVISDNSYTFYYEVEPEFGSKSSANYKSRTISGDVTIVEDPEIKTPYLQVYSKEGIKSVWGLAIDWQTKYVFYVPDGTVKNIYLD